jgi:hypothetical protein
MSSFIPVGAATNKVVIDLASRRKPIESPTMRMLKASVADLDGKERRRLEVERAKALITKGLNILQDNASPEEAIQYMRNTLAAISGAAE